MGDDTRDDEQPLPGGASNYGQVVRIGDTVRRPLREYSPAVHTLLRHLEAVGFTGAPRLLDIDEQGREVLTYIEGVVPLFPPPAWSRAPAVAQGVARLVAEYHEAVRSFAPPADAPWNSHVLPGFADSPLICHNDLVRSNVVFRDGRAVALIDFDRAAPARPEWEIGLAVQQWIPLRGEEDPPETAGPRTAARIRAFCDAYGLAPEIRPRVLDVVLASEAAGYEELRRHVDAGDPAYVELWNGGAAERIEQRRHWLAKHHDMLLDAL
ncbi:phosphotransferase [Actinoplanes sp. NPDC026623]|uniref:phosphotransferase n=1 Tax=Actinoplanes sp. NPDC026623 TaxID=3155610 RepID=UPI0033D056A1